MSSKTGTLAGVLAGVMMVVSCFSCSGFACGPMSNDAEDLISKNLHPGSGEKEILDLFESQGWVFTFTDDIGGLYQAFIPGEDELPKSCGRTMIEIFVDERKMFVRSRVEIHYTGP